MKKKDIKTNIIFPMEMWEQAKNQAVKERISLGELVRKSLGEYLKKKSKKKGDEKPLGVM
ncbi:MAG: hypothetical protein KKH04_05965 [Proteobacteria bacterium]|nr:hypothetical protein [Pseudomonadota bacterium]